MSNVISGNWLRCVMLLSHLCRGPIVSSYCVLVKIKRRITRGSVSNELAVGFRGQSELDVLEDGSIWLKYQKQIICQRCFWMILVFLTDSCFINSASYLEMPRFFHY